MAGSTSFQTLCLCLGYRSEKERGYGHPFMVEYTEGEGLFIYAESFTEEDFDPHICLIFGKLITAAGLESIDFTYCVVGDEFSPRSHHGGTIEVFRDGTMDML